MAEKENQTEEIRSIIPDPEVRMVHQNPTGKTSWPELVGLTAEEAEKKVKEDMSAARVFVVPSDSFVTMDYRTDRVRIFIDPSGKVSKPPRIG